MPLRARRPSSSACLYASFKIVVSLDLLERVLRDYSKSEKDLRCCLEGAPPFRDRIGGPVQDCRCQAQASLNVLHRRVETERAVGLARPVRTLELEHGFCRARGAGTKKRRPVPIDSGG